MTHDTRDTTLTPEQLAQLEDTFTALEQTMRDPTLTAYQRRAMAEALKPLMQKIEDTRRVLELRLLKRSLAVMYHAKMLGAEGNASAQALYEELAARAPQAEIVPFPVRGKVGG